MNWWKRNNVHIYGIVGIIIGIVGLSIAFLKSDPPAYTSPSNSSLILKKDVENLIYNAQRSELRKMRVTTPSSQRKETLEFPARTTSGFELETYTIVFDLRSFKPIPSKYRGKKHSYVVQEILQTIRKTSKSETYFLPAHTSGFDVYVRSMTKEPRLTAIHANEADERAVLGKYPVKPRLFEFDVSNIPDNGKFGLHILKTYVDAFQNEDQSWVGVNVGLPTRSISYIILFPKDRPYTAFKRFANDSNSSPSTLPSDEQFLADEENHLWIWWKITDPKPNYEYNVDWEW